MYPSHACKLFHEIETVNLVTGVVGQLKIRNRAQICMMIFIARNKMGNCVVVDVCTIYGLMEFT